MLGTFQKLNEEQGRTIILITHEPDVAEHAKRIIVLRDGLITSIPRPTRAAEPNIMTLKDTLHETYTRTFREQGSLGAHYPRHRYRHFIRHRDGFNRQRRVGLYFIAHQRARL